jgi:hypothetical protein
MVLKARRDVMLKQGAVTVVVERQTETAPPSGQVIRLGLTARSPRAGWRIGDERLAKGRGGAVPLYYDGWPLDLLKFPAAAAE